MPLQRLVIKDIDVENFKSYAGRHKIGPFHKTFTAVVGPNGSGKSNVIDAMLFVFGKNAKKIRLEKLAELIHSSAAYPNLSHASVTVNFIQVMDMDENDPEKAVEMAGTEMKITREVLRSGGSQYFIDGRKETRETVVNTLKGHGVDLDHNRFLILQGEVEQIALMKPKGEKEGEEGLLEYFDDLIGTNQYIDRIQAAAKIAETAQESRLQSLDILRKTENERNLLTAAKDQAIDFVTRDNQLNRQLHIMCQLKGADVERELREPRAQIKQFEDKMMEIQTLIDEKKEEANAKKALIAAEKEKSEACLKELRTYETQREKADAELAEHKASVEQADKDIKKQNQKKDNLHGEIRKLEMQIQDAKRTQEVDDLHYGDAKKAVEELQPQYERMSSKLADERAPLQKRYDALLDEMRPYEKELGKASQAVETAEARMQVFDAEIREAQQDIAHVQQQHQSCCQNIENTRRQIADADAAAELEVQERPLIEKRDAAVKMKFAVNAEINSMKAELNAGQNDDRVVQFLNSQKELTGYFGTLRHLGRIDDEYDIAAGAASNMWNFHVCEDANTATRAVRLLKENGMSASFLDLQTIRRNNERQMDEKFHAPAGAQRLFDLIQPTDRRFTVAFFNAVKNTLVTDTLENARKIGLGGSTRYRVVSKRGEVVEPSGAILGGGDRLPPGAKLKASHAPIDKNKARERLMQLQAKLQEAAALETEASNQLGALQGRLTNRMTPQERRQKESNLRNLSNQVTQIEARIEEMQNEHRAAEATYAKRRADVQRAIDTARAQEASAQEAIHSRRSEAEGIKYEIENIGGPTYRTIKETLEESKKKIVTLEKKAAEAKRSISRYNTSIESKKKSIEDIEEKIEELMTSAAETNKAQTITLEKKVADWDGRILDVKGRIDNHGDIMADIEATIKEMGGILRSFEKDLDSLKFDRDELAEQMREKLEEAAKYENKMRDCSAKVADNAERYGMETMTEELLNMITEDNPIDDPEKFSLRIPESETAQYSFDNCQYMAQNLNTELKKLKDKIDFDALHRWRERDEEYRKQKGEYDELVAKVNAAEHEMEELQETRKIEFMKYFDIIQRQLKHMYQMLTQGGDADIELVDTQDPFEGINFIVRPPRKSWKAISNLSGGEKTLSSLALVFALHHIRPTPVYVMDEIDAALDFRNVSIVAKYVLEQAKGAQFIIISLRQQMFECAHQLVGICKVNDCTRSLALNPSKVEAEIEKRLKVAANTKFNQMRSEKRRRDGDEEEVEHNVERSVSNAPREPTRDA